MRTLILKIFSFAALAGTIIPSILVFSGDLNLQDNRNIMAVSMVIWFVTAPFWINKKENSTSN